MSRKLDDLSPRFKPKAIEFLARCVETGIALMVIDTLRTLAEQAENLAKGVSWTLNSLHLPQPKSEDENKSLAIDVCPYEIYTAAAGGDKLQWDANQPVWGKMGEIGESLGLKWGVWKESEQVVPAWRRRGKFINIDPGHFEFKG